jgi:hypothetical protein
MGRGGARAEEGPGQILGDNDRGKLVWGPGISKRVHLHGMCIPKHTGRDKKGPYHHRFYSLKCCFVLIFKCLGL